MEDKNFDEKMKDIEREIDTAIDQLFVDKTTGAETDFESFEPQEEPPQEEKAAPEPEESEVPMQRESAETNIHQPLLEELETLKSRVEKFLEWGVTDKALDNVSGTVDKIQHAFAENKFIDSVTRMVSDVLNFLKEDPESHLNEMVEFLGNSFSAIQNLLKSESDEGGNSEEIFNSINSQFSSISSMLTFDIPKIELEERFAMPGEEQAPSEEPETKTEIESPQPEEGEEVQEEKAAEEHALDMAFIDLEEPLEKGEEEEEKEEETIPTEQIFEEAETEILEVEEEEAEAEAIAEEREEEIPSMTTFKTFSDIVSEFSSALKKAENDFYQSNNILELSGRISTEIETLVNSTDKLLSAMSYGVPPDADIKQLQKTVEEINNDFKVLEGLIGAEREFVAKEIVPVLVGRKMLGLHSEFVKNIYSVSREQESAIKQKGLIIIKGEEIPFTDLLDEMGETSNNSNKRIVIVENPKGKRALLVDRVMKRRFALVSDIGESGVQKNAKFYFAEEIPVYEL